MKVLDLFCGAGCFSLGFEQAGFDIVAGVDVWVRALQSFKRNFPDAEIIYKDAKYLRADDLPDCDIIIGSPPCQEWSIGKQAKRTLDTSLIEAFEKTCQELKPTYWIWECVPLTKRFEPCVVLDAYDFGVPQKRRRAFHANFDLPKETVKGKTLSEIFDWKELKVLYNHRSLNRNARSPVYASNRPARTAVTWPIRIYKEGVFTIEMMKQVQGIPRDFQFVGTEQEQYRQIGNAVCPPVAKAIAESVPKT